MAGSLPAAGPSTMPNAVSNQRKFNAGNDISIPQYSSPTASTEDLRRDAEKPRADMPIDSTNTSHSETLQNGSIHEKGETNGETNGDMRHRGKAGKLKGILGEKPEVQKDENGKEKVKFTPLNQLRATLFNSWINVLLIFCKFPWYCLILLFANNLQHPSESLCTMLTSIRLLSSSSISSPSFLLLRC